MPAKKDTNKTRGSSGDGPASEPPCRGSGKAAPGTTGGNKTTAKMASPGAKKSTSTTGVKKASPDAKKANGTTGTKKLPPPAGARKPGSRRAGAGANGKAAEDGGVDVEALADDQVIGPAAPEVEDDEDDDVDDDDAEDEDDDADAVPVVIAPRPAARPQSNRPPGARDEPPPPFDIGERIILTSNTRPRTGTPIADHPVGSPGRVETVLSQTAIIRFDRAPERREVVAFTSLESTDPEAQARRKAEAKALAKAKKAAEAEAQSAP